MAGSIMTGMSLVGGQRVSSIKKTMKWKRVCLCLVFAGAAAFLKGCGSSSCTIETHKFNFYNVSGNPKTTLTFDGLSGACCDFTKDALSGKMPSNANACEGEKTDSFTAAVNGGSCTGTECALKDFDLYGFPDECCTYFKAAEDKPQQKPSQPKSCSGVTKYCMKATGKSGSSAQMRSLIGKALHRHGGMMPPEANNHKVSERPQLDHILSDGHSIIAANSSTVKMNFVAMSVFAVLVAVALGIGVYFVAARRAPSVRSFPPCVELPTAT